MIVTVGILLLLLALALAQMRLMGKVAALDEDMQRQVTALRKEIAALTASWARTTPISQQPPAEASAHATD